MNFGGLCAHAVQQLKQSQQCNRFRRHRHARQTQARGVCTTRRKATPQIKIGRTQPHRQFKTGGIRQSTLQNLCVLNWRIGLREGNAPVLGQGHELGQLSAFQVLRQRPQDMHMRQAQSFTFIEQDVNQQRLIQNGGTIGQTRHMRHPARHCRAQHIGHDIALIAPFFAQPHGEISERKAHFTPPSIEGLIRGKPNRCLIDAHNATLNNIHITDLHIGVIGVNETGVFN